MKSLIMLLFFLSLPVFAGQPAARFELASVPQVSQAASRLGHAIAPRFRDTAAAVTLALTMGGTRYGMDLTRPSEIYFYSFGEKPAMRIVAYVLAGIQEPQNRGKLWGLQFIARRKGDLVVFDTEGLSEPFPTVPPGKNLKKGELLRGTVRAGAVRRQFRFGSFNSGDPSARLILKGLDELLTEIQDAGVVFSADENTLKLELSVRPQEKSALREWMGRPLPPPGRIEIYPEAELVSVLRLSPTETLKEYGKNYLMQGKSQLLPKSLPDAVTGFAAAAIRNSGRSPSVRLAVGTAAAQSPALRKEIGRLGYTPYPGWFQLRRQPPLFCSETAGQVIFCGMDSLDKAALDDLLRPQDYSGSVPDRPFVCLDLKNPDRPLAELRFEKDAMKLILQASDSWFASCRPLLEKPLLVSEKQRP